ISEGRTWQGEICNRRADGELYWMESTIVPFMDELGIPNQYVAVRTEITDLVNVKHALEVSEKRLQQSQKFANLGTWEWNVDSGELIWSQNIAELFGFDPSVKKSTYDEFLANVHEEDRDEVIEVIHHCIDLGQQYNVVHRVVWSDGSIHWLRQQGEVLLNKEHGSKSMLGVVQDVTQEQVNLIEIEKAHATADRANQAKTEFLSSMSHELRTPLNAILGFCQLLSINDSENLSSEQLDYISELKQAGDHLLTLINEVLDLSKIEAGNFSLNLVSVNLSEAIQECIGLMQPLANERKVTINSQLEGFDKLFVKVDANRLKQVIINLLSNAVKYNIENGSINISAQSLDNDRVQVRIDDTGKGLSRAEQERLFVPFDRLGAEETSVDGTGIGLVITQKLLRLMGGEIGYQKLPEGGSRFWFTVNL
ncbi:MAG: ATP-binding protein, partial [Gammaproteobacteria bacterium]|nr:ATP-binding protein [Gammaproteobacteria bacterium]